MDVVAGIQYATRVTFADANGICGSKQFNTKNHCADATAFVKSEVIGKYAHHKMEPQSWPVK